MISTLLRMINKRSLLFFIFFISGFSGLIYESIWTHYLKLFLGHAAYAQTLVLAIFMGGMAIGAWLCSRFSTRWQNLLVGYAIVEGVIGIGGFGFHPLFTNMMNFSFDIVIPQLGSSSLIVLYKWTIAALMVLPQSILLGMTFPLMSGGVLRLFPDHKGGSIAMLYFTNSLGGAIGVLVSGFITIRWLGLDGTIRLAGMLNLLLALVVWRLFASRPSVAKEAGQLPDAITTHGGYPLMLVVAMLTGMASFVYEIGWIRMLSLVLGSSTHAFELMLSAFIFGLALGGLWIRGRIDHLASPVRFLAGVQILMGLSALATLPIYGQSFNFMQWLINSLEKTEGHYLLFNLASHGLAMLIMMPATFCAGMTLPLITHALLRQGIGERAIGAVYGINTLGAIIGVIFAVHIGMPYLGLKGLLLGGAAIDIGLGLLLFRRYGLGAVPWLARFAGGCGLATIALVMLTVELSPYKMASGVYRSGRLLDDANEHVLIHRDGKTATISLTSTKTNLVSIRTNGKTDAAINMRRGGIPSPDELTMTLIGAIPLLLRPDAKHVANIGFGSGMTGHVLLASPGVERLDTVEIEPAMVETARAMQPFNARIFSDLRSHIYIEDAKTFFSSHKQQYDLITSEPSNPWVSGVAGLFSSEFYNYIKRYLKEGGILAQWLHVYEFDPYLLTSVVNALASQFADIVIFSMDHQDLLILASDQDILFSKGLERFAVPELIPELNRVGVNNIDDIRLRLIGNRALLLPLLTLFDVPANSDYFPYVDQFAVKARFLGKSAREILFPMFHPLPMRRLLLNWEINNKYTMITQTPKSTDYHPAFTATYFRDRLAGKETPIGWDKTSKELREQLAKADRILDECCTLPSHGDKVYILYQIALITLPYLNAEELAEVWDNLGRLECASNLGKYETTWVKLFKAIGQKDAAQILHYANWLLQKPNFLTDARAKYLIGIGMLSHLALGQKEGAHNFWNLHAEKWFGDNEIDIAYRYLVASSLGDS